MFNKFPKSICSNVNLNFFSQCEHLIYVSIRPLTDVYFAGVECLRSEIRAACVQYKNDFPIVVDCSRFMLFDNTFIEMINAVAKDLHDNNVMLILQTLSLKQQRLLPVTDNIRFVNDAVITVDDLIPNKNEETIVEC